MTDREAQLRTFHARRPGVTSRAFRRGGSYERLAARVPQTGRILDVASGDGTLLALLGPRAIGVDLSREELALAGRAVVQESAQAPAFASGAVVQVAAPAFASGAVVQGRAQALPFADGAFAAATCHLAFMLFDDVEQVVAELARVLVPGAPFLALLGGGPTADGDDAFHAFARMLPRGRSFGDPRASSEAGWRELFRDGWRDIAFERWELDLSGCFDEVWAFLGSSYQLDEPERAERALRVAFPGDEVPCRVAAYLASAIRR